MAKYDRGPQVLPYYCDGNITVAVIPSIEVPTMSKHSPAPTPLTPAVFHVLLSLSEGPLHGYAIMKRVEADSGLIMGPGTIYGSIRRLADAGLVEEEAKASSGGRRGTSFSLTTAGRATLAAEAKRIQRLAGLGAVRAMAAEGGSGP